MAVSRVAAFTDTLTTISGSYDNGPGDWETFSIVSGFMQPSSAGFSTALNRNTGVYSRDHYSKITVNNITASATDFNAAGPSVCCAGGANEACYTTSQAGITTGSKYFITEVDNSFGFTDLASTGTGAGATGPFALTIEREATALRLYSTESGSETLVLSASDGTLVGGFPGCGAYAQSSAATARISDIEGGSLWQVIGSYLVAIGPPVSGTAGVTPLWVAGHAANDVAFTYIESAGGEAANLGTANGFAAVADSPSAVGVTTAGTRLSVYWCRASGGSQSGPIVTDPGDHVYARLVVVRGLITTGDPWDVTAASQNAIAVTSTTAPGDTTTVVGCLILQGISWSIGNAGPIFSSPTNTDLTGLVELADEGTTQGNGGGLGVFGATKTTAGAFGNTTVTCTSSITASHTMALKPAGSGGGDTFDVALAEPATPTDAISGLMVAARALAEAASLADSLSSLMNASRTLSEMAAATDAPAAATTAPATLSETATSVVNQAAALSASPALAEVANAADLINAGAATVAALIETASAADALTRAMTAAVSLPESAALTEVLTATAAMAQALVEIVSPSDTVATGTVYSLTYADSANLQDLLDRAMSATAALAEGANTNAVLTMTAQLNGALSEVGNALDQLLTVTDVTVSIVETSSLADYLATLSGGSASPGRTIAVPYRNRTIVVSAKSRTITVH